MQGGDVAALVRDTLFVIAKLGGPPLLATLTVGVAIALFQAVTQINESTLAFVPKLLALGVTLLLTGTFLFTTLADFTTGLFDRIVAIGGS